MLSYCSENIDLAPHVRVRVLTQCCRHHFKLLFHFSNQLLIGVSDVFVTSYATSEISMLFIIEMCLVCITTFSELQIDTMTFQIRSV